MDHGVISSWSHIMVSIFCVYGIKIMFRSNTIPGIVSFIVQLHSTSFTVVWQV